MGRWSLPPEHARSTVTAMAAAPIPAARRWARSGETRLLLLLVGLIVASTAVHLVRGAGYVLDDWFLVRNAAFDGAWGAGGVEQGAARPGSVPIFALVFGAFGTHPLPGFLLLAAINSVTAVLTYRLLRVFVDPSRAAVVALLWVVVPNHTSTEMWLTGSIIATSQLALTAGLLLGVRLERTQPEVLGGWILLTVAVASYEASLPAAAVGAVVLPSLARRRIDLTFAYGAAAACAVPAFWILTHWYGGKELQEVADPGLLVMANFGWGLTPGGVGHGLAVPFAVAAMTCITVAAARLMLPSFRATTDDWLVLAGLVTMVVGFLPFVRYFYQPLGAGDRTNYLSAVGGAVVWAGAFGMVRTLDRRLAAAALGLVLVVAGAARWERVQLWSQAGLDAQAIADAVVAAHPDPDQPIALGPEPILRENVGAYFDDSNVQGALSAAYGRDVEAGILHDPAAFEAADGVITFDIRDASRLDEMGLLGR